MILQTIQPNNILSTVEKYGYYVNKTDFHNENDWGFKQSYEWMKEKLNHHKIKNPYQAKHLLWAWAWAGDRNKKTVDLRTRKSNEIKEHSLITFKKNDNEFLLSDFHLWHYVLNYWPISTHEKEHEFWDKHDNYLRYKPETNTQLDYLIKKSWDIIFKLKMSDDIYNLNLKKNILNYLQYDTTEPIIIQACVWDIKEKDILNIKKINF